MKKIVSERSGLIMISAALLVILFISYQLIAHRYSVKEQTLKQQGRNIAQVLSTLPFEQLAIKNGRSNILELVFNKNPQSSFSYAAIVDLEGKPLAISTLGSTTIPQIQLTDKTNLWPTEHQFSFTNRKQ